MNMNNIDENDYRELTSTVKNFITAEFVIVPPNFDLKTHLKMREKFGIFSVSDIDINQANIICDAIKYSPVFSTMNNANMNPQTCFFILQVLSEINLIVKKLDNPFRRMMNANIYKEYINKWQQDRTIYIRGQEVERVSFIFINLYHMLNKEIYNETLEVCKQIEKFQSDIDNLDFKGGCGV